jgi:N-acetylglucosamine-6-phosphate deacetylase
VAVKNISEVTGLPLKELVKSSSLSAANALGLQGIGKIEPGYAADIVLLDDDFNCKVTMVDGEVRYDAR